MADKKVTSDDVAPRAAVAEEKSASKVRAAVDPVTPPSLASPASKYRNISTTLLTLDSGKHFPRNAGEALTDAEVERFQQAERNSGNRHIARVGGE
jgi:hypothetical protein